MSISHLAPGELGFLGGGSWSCGCLGVNRINWESSWFHARNSPSASGRSGLGDSAPLGSLPSAGHSTQVHPQLMPPGLALSPDCSSCPQPNGAVPACPAVGICLDKEQDPNAGMSPNPTPAGNRDQSGDMLWSHCLLPSLVPALSHPESLSRSFMHKNDPAWLASLTKNENWFRQLQTLQERFREILGKNK